jgi:hypothetical protein
VGVRERYGLVERVERGDPDDRTERLGRGEIVLCRHTVDDRGVIVEAAIRVTEEPVPWRRRGDPPCRGRTEHAMVIPNQLEPRLEALREPPVDHGSVQDRSHRVSDRRLGDGLAEAGDEVLVHICVDDRRAERRAPLAGGAEATEQRTLDREIEIRVWHHDQRILAAELQARRLQMPSAELTDPPSDLRRPRETDLVDHAFGEGALETVEGRRAVREDELERSLGESRVQKQLCERVGDRRGVLRRLPHDGVPAEQGGHQVPRWNRHREVAGGDHGGGPHRRPEREQLLVRHLGGHGLSVESPALAEEERAGVDHLLYLAA